jgi:hypothetical protein
MEKLNGVLRISALLPVFVLVGFAGCGTAPQAGGGQSGGGIGTEDGGTAQLARDLGKAVNGGTVTLTGRAGINTALVVPEGVTLDLTADGAALELRDSAVLTVDDAVNARGSVYEGEEGNLRFHGEAAINGSGTICLKSKGELLYIGKDKKFTLDGVTPVGLEDNDDSLILVDEGGELFMKSGVITGNTRIGEGWTAGGGVLVAKSGAFTMEGGTISGNSAIGTKGGAGGGVVVGYAAFTMKGGRIQGGTDSDGFTKNIGAKENMAAPTREAAQPRPAAATLSTLTPMAAAARTTR